MEIFRKHLLGIVLFPVGLLVMVVPLSMAVVRVNAPYLFFLVPIFGPVVAMVLVAAALGLTAYHTDVSRRQAEWSVLAPVLAVGVVVALYASHVAENLLLGPRSLIRSPGTLDVAAVTAAGLVAVCAACGALAAWWMKGDAREDIGGGLKRELAALAILIPFALWPRTVATLVANRMGWGVGETFGEVWEDADLRYVLQSTLALAAVALPVALVTALLWRRQPTAARWRGTALVSMWVVVSTWLGQLYRWLPQFDYDNWVQTFVTGVVAGGLALAYVHGVVVPLVRRARRQRAARESAAEPAADARD
ncbi:MAG: hypothetical protein R6X20_08880 [Phycisphaerae bacterium]